MRRANLLNTELCFSSAFFIMTTGAPKPANVAIAALIIDADHGVIQVNDVWKKIVIIFLAVALPRLGCFLGSDSVFLRVSDSLNLQSSCV